MSVRTLFNRIAERFWRWLEFPWVYSRGAEPTTYMRTCRSCGSTQQLVVGTDDHHNIWLDVEPFNVECPLHE